MICLSSERRDIGIFNDIFCVSVATVVLELCAKQSKYVDHCISFLSHCIYHTSRETYLMSANYYSCRGPVLVRSRLILLDLGPNRDQISWLPLDLDWTRTGPLLDRTAGPVQVRSRVRTWTSRKFWINLIGYKWLVWACRHVYLQCCLLYFIILSTCTLVEVQSYSISLV